MIAFVFSSLWLALLSNSLKTFRLHATHLSYALDKSARFCTVYIYIYEKLTGDKRTRMGPARSMVVAWIGVGFLNNITSGFAKAGI